MTLSPALDPEGLSGRRRDINWGERNLQTKLDHERSVSSALVKS